MGRLQTKQFEFVPAEEEFCVEGPEDDPCPATVLEAAPSTVWDSGSTKEPPLQPRVSQTYLLFNHLFYVIAH